MAVDDVAAVRVQAELPQDHAGGALVVPEAEIGVFRLLPGALVVHHGPLEGVEHPAGEGAVVAAPEIPHHVQGRFVAIGPGAFYHDVRIVQQRLAGVPFAAVADPGKLPVLGHGDAAVVEQIAVAAEICAAIFINEVNMAAQGLALPEGGHIFLHQGLFLRRQLIGIGRVDGGPEGRIQGVHAIIQADGVACKVDALQHQPGIHAVARVALDNLPLQLKAQGIQGVVQHFARGAAVHLPGKLRQRAQGDAVAPLQQVGVAVVHGDAQHREDAGRAARRRAQPQDVVVAPLDVDVGVLHQRVQQAGRFAAPVENVAYDVQPLHGQALDELRHGHDDLFRRSGLHNGVQQGVVVAELVFLLVPLDMQQLVQHKAPLRRHLFAHIAAGVFAGQHLRQGAQPLQHVPKGAVTELILLPQAVQLLPGVVDQRAEGAAALLPDLLLIQAAHLFQNHAGAVVQNVPHRAVFAVQVADKMFRALGQGEYGPEIDDLRARRRPVGVFFRQKFKIFPGVVCHVNASCALFFPLYHLFFPLTIKSMLYPVKVFCRKLSGRENVSHHKAELFRLHFLNVLNLLRIHFLFSIFRRIICSSL